MKSAALLRELARTGRLLAEARQQLPSPPFTEFSRHQGIDGTNAEVMIELFQAVMNLDDRIDPVPQKPNTVCGTTG